MHPILCPSRRDLSWTSSWNGSELVLVGPNNQVQSTDRWHLIKFRTWQLVRWWHGGEIWGCQDFLLAWLWFVYPSCLFVLSAHWYFFSTFFKNSHMIWIFFPIPILCLVLLAIPFSKIEKQCTNVVGGIFFTRVSVGFVYIRLVWVFLGFSCLIFWIACRTLQMGFGSARVPCSGWVKVTSDALFGLTTVNFCS